MSDDTPQSDPPEEPVQQLGSPERPTPNNKGVPETDVLVPSETAPSSTPSLSLTSPTALPGLILAVLGLLVALSGLMPWFTYFSFDFNGFRGDLGEPSGWILGVPVGWVLLLAGGLSIAAGLLLALTSQERYRKPAALVALVVSTLTAIGIVAERFAVHSAFDDAMAESQRVSDPVSQAINESLKLGDGIGIWLGLLAALAAAAVAVWALVILSAQDDLRARSAS